MVCLCNMVTAPFAGYLAGRYGKRIYLTLLGSICMLIIHMLFGFTNNLHPAILTGFLGLVQSVMDTSLMPSIGFVVDQSIYGRAYSLVVFVWNIGLMLVPIIIGSIMDRTENDVFTANLVFVVLSSAAVVSSSFLFYVNKFKLGDLLNKSEK